MDEVLVRQLVRQLKIINFWITLFGTVIVVALIVLGILVFKVATFVRTT